MANEQNGKQRRRRQGISRQKELASKPTHTVLWAADHELFLQIAKRKNLNPSQFLREIVHDWAVTARLSGQAKDTMEMAGPIRKLHQQIIADEIAPIKAALATITERLGTQPLPAALPEAQPQFLTPPESQAVPVLSATADTALASSDTQPSTQNSALLLLLQRLADELEANKVELGQLRAFAISIYLLSGQNFAATWATLDFVQRYMVEPAMRFDPAHAHDPQEAIANAIRIHRDDARQEGLQMVDRMSVEFKYPEDFEMYLIVPEDLQ